jgi:hypothetical protein
MQAQVPMKSAFIMIKLSCFANTPRKYELKRSISRESAFTYEKCIHHDKIIMLCTSLAISQTLLQADESSEDWKAKEAS